MTIKPQDCPLVAVFAANVRRRRSELGLSQEALAERAGVHRTYIGMLERSEKNVTIFNIWRLASALEVDASDLLTEPRQREH
ncbi:helix-turn-helix transcriptional regulator [Pseudomonas sp. SIMBA_064]